MTVTQPAIVQIRELLMDHFDLSEPMTVNDRAGLLSACIDLSADLAMVRSSLEESLIADMESNEERTPYGTLVRNYRPIAPKYDGRRLAFVVAEKVQPANDDGEPLPLEEYRDSLTEALMAASGIDNASHKWRTGQLKARGIDPKSYCTADGWKASVRFA